MSKKTENVELLLLIRENKDVLFGAFNPLITYEKKQTTWQKIFDDCAAKGHSWTIGRDAIWLKNSKFPSMKTVTKAKVDNANKTGSAGGRQAKFTETDNILLDIIGRESEALVGVAPSPTRSASSSCSPPSTAPLLPSPNIPQPSMTNSQPDSCVMSNITNRSIALLCSTADDTSATSTSPTDTPAPPPNSQRKKRPRSASSEEASAELISTKKQLLEATITGQLLLNEKLEFEKKQRELDTYEQQLRIMKLEKELNIFPHKYPLLTSMDCMSPAPVNELDQSDELDYSVEF